MTLLLPLREPLEAPPAVSIDDVRRQSYPDWELCVAAGPLLPPALQSFLNHAVTVDPRIRLTPPDRAGNSLNSALALATGEFVLALASESRMTEHALYVARFRLGCCMKSSTVRHQRLDDKVRWSLLPA